MSSGYKNDNLHTRCQVTDELGIAKRYHCQQNCPKRNKSNSSENNHSTITQINLAPFSTHFMTHGPKNGRILFGEPLGSKTTREPIRIDFFHFLGVSGG